MENLLRIVRNCLVIGVVVGLVAIIVNDNYGEVEAATGARWSAAHTVDLTGDGTMSLSDFSNNADLIARLNEVAELDDVDKTMDEYQDAASYCESMKDMTNKMVTRFGDIAEGSANNQQKTAMLYNTWFLQRLIYCASMMNGAAKTTIKLPEGTFYFASGHRYMANRSSNPEKHVIKLYDNVALIGVGSDVDSKKTILKPYSAQNDFKDNNGKIVVHGGMDMFFFNNLSAWGLERIERNNSDPENEKIELYLSNINFADFVIDSEATLGADYDTSGKGFMINLFNNGTWDNVTVQNTDGTGFGVDCPIGNSGIYNSRAYGNGKGVWRLIDRWGDFFGVQHGGGSGFGIGTGFSNDEQFEIVNSEAKGNGIFGFFYEHQDRFGPATYQATTSGGFSIKNSTAEANVWNFGGLRANNVTISNVTSTAGTVLSGDTISDENYKIINGKCPGQGKVVCTLRHIHFSDDSRNIKVKDVTLNGTVFLDVQNRSTEWFADAVEWAEKYAIVEDALQINTGASPDDGYALLSDFGLGEQASRADIITMMWRLNEFPGAVLSMASKNTDLSSNLNLEKELNLPTCFEDVNPQKSYAVAIQWAVGEGITNGVGGTCVQGQTQTPGVRFFNGTTGNYETKVTRAEAVTMLYRMAGNPSVGQVEDFVDVTDKSKWYYNAVQWAVQNDITNGMDENNTFAPDSACTREQIIAFLYRYWAKFICPKNNSNCPDSKVLLDPYHNAK